MNAKVLVAELERTGWVREGCTDGVLERLRMRDDGSEVLDADDNVHAFLHVKVFEVFGMDGDRRFKRLLEDLCVASQQGQEAQHIMAYLCRPGSSE